MISSYVAGTIKTRKAPVLQQRGHPMWSLDAPWAAWYWPTFGMYLRSGLAPSLRTRNSAPEKLRTKKKRCQVPSPLSIVAYTLLMLVVSTNSQLINIYEENSWFFDESSLPTTKMAALQCWGDGMAILLRWSRVWVWCTPCSAMGSRFHMLCYDIVGMGLSWVSLVPKIGNGSEYSEMPSLFGQSLTMFWPNLWEPKWLSGQKDRDWEIPATFPRFVAGTIIYITSGFSTAMFDYRRVCVYIYVYVYTYHIYIYIYSMYIYMYISHGVSPQQTSQGFGMA